MKICRKQTIGCAPCAVIAGALNITDVDAKVSCQRRQREVAIQHGLRWYQSLQKTLWQAAIGVNVALDVVFSAKLEGQLSTLIEVTVRKHHRSANLNAGIDIMVLDNAEVLELLEPVLSVKLIRARIGPHVAVKGRTAGFADRRDYSWT